MPIVTRPTAQITSVRFTAAPHELDDSLDHLVDGERGRVEDHCVGCGLRVRGVSLVPEAQIGGKLQIGSGSLRRTAACALGLVGDEEDLHLRFRCHDAPDIAPFDDDVSRRTEPALALAHDDSHLRMPRYHGHETVDLRVLIAEDTSSSSTATLPSAENETTWSRASSPSARPSSSATPSAARAR